MIPIPSPSENIRRNSVNEDDDFSLSPVSPRPGPSAAVHEAREGSEDPHLEDIWRS